MIKQIEMYQAADNQVQVQVQIANIFTEGELELKSVVSNFATTAADGKTCQVEHYNLDDIISAGYSVKSKRGTQFRQSATRRLKNYMAEDSTCSILEQVTNNVQTSPSFKKVVISILNRKDYI